MESTVSFPKSFEQVLTLFGNSVLGVSENKHWDGVDWVEIRKEAKRQSVWNMLTAVYKDELGCPDDIRAELKQSIRSVVVTYYQKLSINLDLLSRMQKKGLHPLVLKGIAVARYYDMPEVRFSADMDVLLPYDELNAAISVLVDLGYSGEPFNKGMYHVAYTHPKFGMIELHVDLYSDFMEDVWFEGIGKNDIILEEPECIELDGTKYQTLGATDHMVFLAVHMAKHFICGGLSMRSMMDLALYAKNNCAKINCDRFWDLMKKARLHSLIATVFKIAERYWGFCDEELLGYETCDETQVSLLLNDLYFGGAEGHFQQKERRNGWYLLHKEKLTRGNSKSCYTLRLFWKNVKHWAKLVFPSKIHLSSKYPVLKKYGLLFPFVWLYWLVVRGMSRVFRWKQDGFYVEEADASKEAKQRLEMFKKMNMV